MKVNEQRINVLFQIFHNIRNTHYIFTHFRSSEEI